jgi:gamma-D-glutamyl-L-lysine dipeptidyl-peptidase
MVAHFNPLVTNPENAIGWGYSSLPLIPLRAEPSERTEMVTQALYGERMLLLEQQTDWVRVALTNDGYQGWCASKMVSTCTLERWNDLDKQMGERVTQPLSTCFCGGRKLLLPAGSLLFQEDKLIKDEVKEELSGLNPSDVAKRFLHAPYLWGGKSILGIDCSGLVQLSFALLGMTLPRDASQQVLLGKPVSSPKEALPGDLAFFANQEGKIVHVGLIMAEGCIIHASGSVRIDKLDHEGIFNKETNSYSHRLSQLKRLSF